MNGRKNLAVPSFGNSFMKSYGLQIRTSIANVPREK